MQQLNVTIIIGHHGCSDIGVKEFIQVEIMSNFRWGTCVQDTVRDGNVLSKENKLKFFGPETSVQEAK